ncbi:CGNR zinc finger domain-containing protein [Streptomyces sp. NPDC003710]
MKDEAAAAAGGDAGLKELPLTGEPLPLELVNTTFIRGGLRGNFVDALATPAELDAWLAAQAAQLGPAVAAQLAGCSAGEEHLRRFVELRAALRGLLAAHVGGQALAGEDLDRLNAAARMAVGWSELSEGQAVRRWAHSDAVLVALGEVAATAVDLLSGPQRELVRACPAQGCMLFFLQNHARRAWCTTGCGNRMRVARHHARQRQVPSADR